MHRRALATHALFGSAVAFTTSQQATAAADAGSRVISAVGLGEHAVPPTSGMITFSVSSMISMDGSTSPIGSPAPTTTLSQPCVDVLRDAGFADDHISVTPSAYGALGNAEPGLRSETLAVRLEPPTLAGIRSLYATLAQVAAPSGLMITPMGAVYAIADEAGAEQRAFESAFASAKASAGRIAAAAGLTLGDVFSVTDVTLNTVSVGQLPQGNGSREIERPAMTVPMDMVDLTAEPMVRVAAALSVTYAVS